jgi:hypothetical protein
LEALRVAPYKKTPKACAPIGSSLTNPASCPFRTSRGDGRREAAPAQAGPEAPALAKATPILPPCFRLAVLKVAVSII